MEIRGCKNGGAAETTAGAGCRVTLRVVAAGRCVVRPLICRKTAEPGTNWKAHQAQARRRAASRERRLATRDAIDARGYRQDSSARLGRGAVKKVRWGATSTVASGVFYGAAPRKALPGARKARMPERIRLSI